MFKVKLKREVKITHNEEDGSSYSIMFKVPAKEEMDIAGLKEHKEKYGEDNASLYLLRSCIVGLEGIGDENGEELELVKEDGSIDEDIQRAVFDAVWDVEDIRDNMLTAIGNVNSKNSKTGVKPA